MIHLIEGFAKIQLKDITHCTITEIPENVVVMVQELGQATSALAETMLC